MSLAKKRPWRGVLASISLALILTSVPGAAETPAGDSKIEEIVITGKTPVPQIRKQLRLVEARLYEEFNLLNDDNDFDIVCRDHRPVGSHFPRTLCKTNIYWDALEEMSEDEASTWSPKPVPNEAYYERELGKRMLVVAMQNEAFKDTLVERKALLVILEERQAETLQ
jgi:hypothetical protein